MTFKDTIFDLEEIIKNNRGGSIDPTLKNGTWYYIDLPFPVTLERMRVSAYSTLSTSGFVYGLSDLFLRYHANNNDYVIADILDLPTTYTDYEFTIPLTASGQGDIDRITTGHFAEHKSDVYHKNRVYYISHDGTECGHRNGDCDFGIHAKRAMVVGMAPIDLQYGEKRETHTDLQVNSAQEHWRSRARIDKKNKTIQMPTCVWVWAGIITTCYFWWINSVRSTRFMCICQPVATHVSPQRWMISSNPSLIPTMPSQGGRRGL
ncbi:MAG: hypothetical protein AAFN11_11755 [Chloroflexota bacterium]